MPPGLTIVSDLHNRAALLAARICSFRLPHVLFTSARHELFSSALHELFTSALRELFTSVRHKLFPFTRLMFLITRFGNVPLAFRYISS